MKYFRAFIFTIEMSMIFQDVINFSGFSNSHFFPKIPVKYMHFF